MKVDYCTQSEKPCGGLKRSAENLQHCPYTSRAISSSRLLSRGLVISLPYLISLYGIEVVRCGHAVLCRLL